MAIIVSDANIFIGVDVAALTLYMFRLPDEFATPDILYQEELSEHHPELPRLGLRIERLGSAVIADVDRMRALYRAPSFNDLLALGIRSFPVERCDRLYAEAVTQGLGNRANVHGPRCPYDRLTLYLVANF